MGVIALVLWYYNHLVKNRVFSNLITRWEFSGNLIVTFLLLNWYNIKSLSQLVQGNIGIKDCKVLNICVFSKLICCIPKSQCDGIRMLSIWEFCIFGFMIVKPWWLGESNMILGRAPSTLYSMKESSVNCHHPLVLKMTSHTLELDHVGSLSLDLLYIEI